MASYRIKIEALVGRDTWGLDGICGKYLVEVGDIDDPATWCFSADANEAKLFRDLASAMACYRQQSRTMPWRKADRKPNRPLTAFSVALESVLA